MTNWKFRFLESVVLGQTTDKGNADQVFAKCVALAYKDMMTAGRYYSYLFSRSKEKICIETRKIIQDGNYTFSRNMIYKTSLLFCDSEIIGNSKKYVTRYGLAQKLVNMTFKYLYVFSDHLFTGRTIPDFSLCDCPLDNTILNKASLNNLVWSKLTQTQYKACQKKITALLNGKNLDPELSNLGNLAFDFLNW